MQLCLRQSPLIISLTLTNLIRLPSAMHPRCTYCSNIMVAHQAQHPIWASAPPWLIQWGIRHRMFPIASQQSRVIKRLAACTPDRQAPAAASFSFRFFPRYCLPAHPVLGCRPPSLLSTVQAVSWLFQTRLSMISAPRLLYSQTFVLPRHRALFKMHGRVSLRWILSSRTAILRRGFCLSKLSLLESAGLRVPFGSRTSSCMAPATKRLRMLRLGQQSLSRGAQNITRSICHLHQREALQHRNLEARD